MPVGYKYKKWDWI